MKIIDVDTVGAYVIFWYIKDYGGDFVLYDEIWRSSFDECFYEALDSWGLPFEICQCVIDSFGQKGYKTVARSALLAQVFA